MNALISWLSRPYPFDGNWRFQLKNAGIVLVFVTLFLGLFRPFGSETGPSIARFWLVSFGFGIITGAVVMLCGAIFRLFPAWHSEKNWSVGKEIFASLVVLSAIGTANWLFGHCLYSHNLSFFNWLIWQKMTCLIGLFPILATAFFKQQILQKRYQTEAENLDSNLSEKKREPSSQPADLLTRLELLGENQGERLVLRPDELLFITAADNYVEVFFEKNGQSASQHLRGSLKKMEDQLAGQPDFFRCHRAFMVNLSKVRHVCGNAQGYRLQVEGSPNLIPVSRSLNAVIAEKLKNR